MTRIQTRPGEILKQELLLRAILGDIAELKSDVIEIKASRSRLCFPLPACGPAPRRGGADQSALGYMKAAAPPNETQPRPAHALRASAPTVVSASGVRVIGPATTASAVPVRMRNHIAPI
jgi:hypothetical protein